MATFSFVKGFSGKANLLYLHDEKNLFIKKSTTNGRDYYECYNCLRKDEANYKPCHVYCTIQGDQCQRNKAVHSHSLDHRIEYRDLQSLNAMRQTCQWLRDNCPSSAYKIPLNEIFMLEISK